MRGKRFGATFSLGWVCCLTCGVASALADPPDDGCYPGSPYGDSDEICIISGNTVLEGDLDCRDLTVENGVTLDTAGYTVRVCSTLTVEANATITDMVSGGAGGSGGVHGNGHDPWEDDDPDYCELQPLCTDGQDGQAGDPPLISQPGQNGRGGHGGGGGAGGGGAWWFVDPYDTDGGNGGDGETGGKGGGYVRISAYLLDNHGIIHANGQAGSGGADAPGTSCNPNIDCNNLACGAEHCEWSAFPPPNPKDISGGGGGGGGGGCGGKGGTVEIDFMHLVHVGEIHANGGQGGPGGDAGGGCCNDHGVVAGGHRDGCSGGEGCGLSGQDGDGGDGGDGEQRSGECSGDGDDGEDGASGQDGDVILHHDGEFDLDQTDVIRYYLDIEIVPPPWPYTAPGWIGGHNTMHVESRIGDLTVFTFRLDQKSGGEGFDISRVRISHYGPGGPWLLPYPDWHWLDDGITVAVDLDHPYDPNEPFYLDVEYEGNPKYFTLNPEEPRPFYRFWVGMGFAGHGALLDPAPIAFTIVQPWYAHLWWPVKDDGPNWNCDKAKADLYFTVPADLYAVSQGILVDTVDGGGTTTYHWQTNYDTAAYLFSVAATNYHNETLSHDDMPVELYVWPETELLVVDVDKKIQKWSRVLDMLILFESYFGAYPFITEKYAIYQWPLLVNACVEHHTATGQLGGLVWVSRNRVDWFPDVELFTAHELAHSWWGNPITCATWNEIWLNEGFAEYAAGLWFENQHDYQGIPGGTELATLQSFMARIKPSFSGEAKPLYVYDESDPVGVFVSGAYTKGPWALHMLRHVLDPDSSDEYGDVDTPRFFDMLLLYWDDRIVEGCTTTDDFNRVAEAYCQSNGIYSEWEEYKGYPTGDPVEDLTWFFGELPEDPEDGQGWIYGRGAPIYVYDWKQDGTSNVVDLWIRQDQPLPPLNEPFFTMPVDVDARCKLSLVWERQIVWNWDEDADYFQEYELHLDQGCEIAELRLDRDNWILKRSEPQPWIPSLITDLGAAISVQDPVAGINGAAEIATALQMGDGERASIWLAQLAYDLPRGVSELDTLGGDWSRAYDINDEGQVVGNSDTTGNVRAFLWLPEPAYGLNAGMNDLGTLVGETEAHARAINEMGQVVGFSGDHAILWQFSQESETWETIDLGTFGGSSAQAWDVNNGGLIVGIGDPNGTPHAIVWQYDFETEDWVMMDLDEGVAYCVNDVGQVGGQSQGQAVIWTFEDEQAVPDPDPLPCPGGLRTAPVAYGINNAGQVVGECDGHACYWQDSVVTDLNDYFSSVTSCWQLKAAWDINEAGKMVGYGTVGGELDSHVFLMTPSRTADCNENDVLDVCDIDPTDPDGNGEVSEDCNGNGHPDECDIDSGYSEDTNDNGIPDECECECVLKADPDLWCCENPGPGCIGLCHRNFCDPDYIPAGSGHPCEPPYPPDQNGCVCVPIRYGDVYPVPGGDCAAEGFDILCVLEAANSFNTLGCLDVLCTGYEAGDIFPWPPYGPNPDGVVEGFDILCVLDAANAAPWCPDPMCVCSE